MTDMDITHTPASRIVEVARLAFSMPDVDFLCFGESDQPSPSDATQAAIQALEDGETRYPDVRGLPALRAALSGYLTGLHVLPVAESRIQVTASGMAALSVALSAVVRAGDRIVMHSPTWPNIANAVQLRGAIVEAIDLAAKPDGGFRLDLDRLDLMMDGARAFILNSPGNPTGWTASEADLRQILAIARRHGAWLIADEVYARLVYDGRSAAPSVLDIADPSDRVIVCNSFSKTWMMTGWRLGWLVVPDGTRDAIADLVEVSHSGVAPFIQHAGVAAVADAAAVDAFRSHCAAGRCIASEALAGLAGIDYRPPDGAFYAFLAVDGLHDSLDLAKKLVTRHGVAVAPGVAFGAAGEGWLRVCFAQSAPLLERAMQRLRDGLRAEMGS
ncbi:pyridoxal phosphate-dependent aminotransferase [Rhodopila sp.]|uniref:pyridoxal phosphate-dependent aminotransferase n=1 Tax=Rhodopila sp. TaxID=2480087 RepID=UPI003D0B73E8